MLPGAGKGRSRKRTLAVSDQTAIGVVSAVISAASIALALILYILGKRRTVPYFSRWGTAFAQLEDSELEAVELVYKGVGVRRLQATRLAFWNGGSEPLQDKIVLDELRIEAKRPDLILEARIAARSLEQNQFQIDPGASTQTSKSLRFRYLDPGHFAVVDVLHTGRSSRLLVHSTLVGAEAGFREIRTAQREAFTMAVGGLLAAVCSALLAIQGSHSWRVGGVVVVISLIGLVSWWASGKVSQLPPTLIALASPPSRASFENEGGRQ